MTIARHLKQASLALLTLTSLGALQNAYAVGTTAGTSISNTATVNYSVGGVAQTAISSAPVSFVVDNRVDLTVTTTNAAPVIANPGTDCALGNYRSKPPSPARIASKLTPFPAVSRCQETSHCR